MPRSRAQLIPLLFLLLLVGFVGWFANDYVRQREVVLAERRFAAEAELRHQQRLAEVANRRENRPVRRYIAPDPIVVPFY